MAVTFNAPPALARVAAATAVVTSLLTQGAIFTLNKVTGTVALRQQDVLIAKSSSGSGIASDGYGNLRLSGSLIAFDGASNEVSISSGSSLRYPIVPLTGSGVAAATGTNVWGNLTTGFAGKIVDADAFLSQVADNNLTSVDILINGTSIFTTPITIDSTETGSHLAATPPVINTAANTFNAYSRISFDVLSPATTAGKDLKLWMKMLQTSFP